MEAVKIENLSFKYPLTSSYALSNVNLSVKKGEFVVIMGMSGCGKTTLLRHIKTEIAPEGEREGNIQVLGGKCFSDSAFYKVGYVPQNPEDGIICDKVWHELSFGLESMALENPEIKGRVGETASFFGIESWFRKDVSSLSGGQKQLLNLMSVIAMRPEIIVLDEPTSRLDGILRERFINVLSKINRETGITVIMSEQTSKDVLNVCDRVIMMDNGGVVFECSPELLAYKTEKMLPEMYCSVPVSSRVQRAIFGSEKTFLNVKDVRNLLESYEKKPKNIVFEKNDENKHSKPLLRAKNVYFRYEKNQDDILRDFSFEVSSGKIVSLTGANGSGKTTALNVMSNILKPYRGSVWTDDKIKISYLSPNAEDMFTENSVYDELLSSQKDGGYDKESFDTVNKAGSLFNINHLFNMNPYDLSGGQRQMVGILKILLSKSDLVFMDEPTKGMDDMSKEIFGNILTELKKTGVSFVIVSHDLEFISKYSDNCAMMFDGEAVFNTDTRNFFLKNAFYTTEAKRLCDKISDNIVTEDDIYLSYEIKNEKQAVKDDFKNDLNSDLFLPPISKAEIKNKEKPKKSIKSVVFGLTFILLGLISAYVFKDETDVFKMYSSYILCFLLEILGFSFFLKSKKEIIIRKKKENSLKKIMSYISFLVLVPVTLFVFTKFFNNERYYFVSVLIIFEFMLPFFVSFEKKGTNLKKVVIISVFTAISVAGRIAFAFLPQFKPMCALIIITGALFGCEAGFITGSLGAFLSNFYFMQGPWTPWQMFAFGSVGFVSGIFLNKGIIKTSRLSMTVFSFFVCLIIYGGIMDPAGVITFEGTINLKLLSLSYITGFPFDLIHAVSTAFFMWISGEYIVEKTERIKMKYGID